MRAVSASLDPTDFRHQAPERDSRLTIGQVDHPFQIRNMGELHVPCACGRPLVGLETEVIADPLGFAVYFFGICLTCGRQNGIYMQRAASTVDSDKQKDEQLRSDVEALVRQVTQLRELGPSDTDVLAEVGHKVQQMTEVA